MREAKRRPEHRARQGDLMRERWANPKSRERMLTANAERNRRPEARAKQSARALARWAAYRERLGLPEPKRRERPTSPPPMVARLPVVIRGEDPEINLSGRRGSPRKPRYVIPFGEPAVRLVSSPREPDPIERREEQAGAWIEKEIAKAAGGWRGFATAGEASILPS